MSGAVEPEQAHVAPVPDAAAVLAAAAQNAAGVMVTADGVTSLQAAHLAGGQQGPEPQGGEQT